jgi:hypothetical protein
MATVGLESAVRNSRNAAVLAVLLLAVALMVCPPLIAAISMVDPGALDGASRWIQRVSPTISYLDYAKAALTVIAPIVMWRAEAGRAPEPPAGMESLEADHAEPRARGLGASIEGS